MKLRTLVLALSVMAAPLALAKLPPLSDDAKAKAAEAAAKSAWTDKVAAFQLCRSMDKVADGVFKSAKAAGKTASAPVATPPCADPGPYASPTAASAPAPTTTATTAAAPPPAKK